MGNLYSWQFYEHHFAAPRLRHYLDACSGDKVRAMLLYEWNTEISAAFWESLGHLEVALRNTIDRQMTSRQFSKNRDGHWIYDDARELGRDGKGTNRHKYPMRTLQRPSVVCGRTTCRLTLGKSSPRYLSVSGTSLSLIRDCDDIRVGAVYRRTEARGSGYYRERADLYEQLVRRWDAQHAAEGSFVFISMDGDGSDPTYFNAHRSLKLDTRHVIEDPMFHDSKRSQWTQMADLVAYVAYQHIDRHPRNEHAWNWYTDYLADSDPHSVPQELNWRPC